MLENILEYLFGVEPKLTKIKCNVCKSRFLYAPHDIQHGESNQYYSKVECPHCDYNVITSWIGRMQD